MITIDFKNAFNSICRSAIASSLLERHPHLYPFFSWGYGQPTPLLLDGFVNGWSQTGVRQGDPLGPAFFSLGIQPLLEEIDNKLPQVTVMAYLDDVILAGPLDKITEAFDIVKTKAFEIGLVVNTAKCQLILPPGHEAMEPFPDFPTAFEGFRALGVPIGTRSYVAQEARKEFNKMSEPLQTIKTYSADIGFLLTRYCVNSRPTFLLRTVDPELTDEGSSTFDTNIDSTLAALSQVPSLPLSSQLLRGLPYRMGGLSAPRANRTRTAAYVASWCAARRLMGDLDVWEERDRSHEEALVKSMVPEWDPTSDDPPNVTQRGLNEQVVGSMRTELLDLLSGPQSRWFTSQARKGSASWLSSPMSRNPALSLSPEDYRENLRFRLLLPVVDDTPSIVRRCTCRHVGDQDLRDNPYHFLSCPKINGPRIRRHNDIRDALAQFLRHAVPAAQVATEPVLAQGPPMVRADLRISHSSWNTHVDVAVANPAGFCYANETRTPGVAKEEQKIDAYHSRIDPSFHILPFVLECTGTFAPRAADLIDKLTGLNLSNYRPNADIGKHRRFFKRRCQLFVARSLASMARLWRSEAPVHDIPDAYLSSSTPDEIDE